MSCRCTCGGKFKNLDRLRNHIRDTKCETPEYVKEELARRTALRQRRDMQPTHSGSCMICAATPVVPATGMCTRCTYGAAHV